MIVESYTLASSTAFATPYYVIRGELPGPVFMVVSGIHGNETRKYSCRTDHCRTF